jgi:hypothetical protein
LLQGIMKFIIIRTHLCVECMKVINLPLDRLKEVKVQPRTS